MSNPRKIRIRLTQRAASDSPYLLKTVSEAFQYDDLDISIGDRDTASDDDLEVNVRASQQASKVTEAALDNQDKSIRTGGKEVASADIAKRQTRQWIKIVRQEGFRVLVREGLQKLLEETGNVLL